MIKINSKIVDFQELLEKLNHSSTWLMATELNNIKVELEIRKEFLVLNTFEFGQNVEEVALIEQQLVYIRKNLVTLEEALEYHESKIIEEYTGLYDHNRIFLN